MPTGTTTILGSFSSVGGTFAHNNATILFAGSGAATIAASGTPFTNAFYRMTFGGSGSWTFLDTSATSSNDVLITGGSVVLPSNTLSIGGSFTQSSGSFAHNNGTTKFTGSGTKTIDVNSSSFGSLAFSGNSNWSFLDTNVTLIGSLTTSLGTTTLPSGTLTIGGSVANAAVVLHNNGTVLFNSSDIGETINLGNSSLYNMTFGSPTGGWTIAQSATTTNNLTLTSASSFTLSSGNTLAVGAVFMNSIGGASTTWAGSTLSLEAGNYSLNTKTTGGDAYGTIRIKSNTDIQMWNSTSSAYEVASSGSLYSQDHNAIDGDLYIFGEYLRTTGTEYWNYGTDFDGASLTSSSRKANIRFANGATATFVNATVEILGTSTASTTLDRQLNGLYGITLDNSTLNAKYYDVRHLNQSGLNLLNGTNITSLTNGHFTLDALGGSAMTLSKDTIESNLALQVYNVGFDSGFGTSNVTSGDGSSTFIFFDDFNDGTINTSKWTKDVELGSITETGGYLRAGGGITSGNYGHVSLGSEVGYASFLNNSVVWRARNSVNGIGELAFRGDFGTARGYKARFDARTGTNGNAFLEPPYSGWAFSAGAGCNSDGAVSYTHLTLPTIYSV